MSAKAVVVLAAMARDEFERTWRGYDEPFSFIDGDDGPVEWLTAKVDGKTFRLPARQTVEVLLGQLEGFREQVEADDSDEDEVKGWFDCLSDDEMAERAWDRLENYWSDQLEYAPEFLAVLDAKSHWFVEAWKELVAAVTDVSRQFWINYEHNYNVWLEAKALLEQIDRGRTDG
jgi:hypothetical protein